MYVLHESSTHLCVCIYTRDCSIHMQALKSHFQLSVHVISYRTSNLHTHKSHHAFISFPVHYSGSLSYCKLSSCFVLTVLGLSQENHFSPLVRGQCAGKSNEIFVDKIQNFERVTCNGQVYGNIEGFVPHVRKVPYCKTTFYGSLIEVQIYLGVCTDNPFQIFSEA